MDISYPSSNPEIWGGIECTINRIGDTFRNQLNYAGYYERTNDLDLIAQLGIQALRFPVLWEAHQNISESQEINWTQTSKDLGRLRYHNITPIVLLPPNETVSSSIILVPSGCC